VTEQEESLSSLVYYSVNICKLNTTLRQVFDAFQKKVGGGLPSQK
jgi:hypothetical protein